MFWPFLNQYRATKFNPKVRQFLLNSSSSQSAIFQKIVDEDIQNFYDRADKAFKHRFDKMLNFHPEEGFDGILLTSGVNEAQGN